MRINTYRQLVTLEICCWMDSKAKLLAPELSVAHEVDCVAISIATNVGDIYSLDNLGRVDRFDLGCEIWGHVVHPVRIDAIPQWQIHHASHPVIRPLVSLRNGARVVHMVCAER